MSVTAPEIGELVRVRGQHWVVTDVHEPDAQAEAGQTLVDLLSVSDGGYGAELKVVWEVEPGRAVLEAQTLPEVAAGGFDSPGRLAAFLDAIRWSAVTSADTRRLQAPFRSGVKIEDYQLEPVARALRAPRVNLLIADDVGLGKTIEAGLTALELLLRHRASRIMVICPAGLTVKWRDEMAEKFGLDFTAVDADLLKQLRRTHGLAANPFRVYPLTIVSMSWLRGPRCQRLLDEVLDDDDLTTHRPFDLLIVDEAHHVAPAAPQQAYAVDSQQTKAVRRLARHFEHRLFLTATPHNGYTESFTALLEVIDPQRFVRGMTPDGKARDAVVVRRLKDTIVNEDGSPKFPGRDAGLIPVDFPESEREVHGWLGEYARLRRQRLGTSRAAARAADLVTLLLKKRLFSSPAAFAQTISVHRESMLGQAASRRIPDEVPPWLEDLIDDGTLDDDALADSEHDNLTRSARLQPAPTAGELDLLDRMERWALAHEARADAKAKAMLDYLAAVCKPDGLHWTNERVVVFTEYRDTQRWLADLLVQAGLGDGHLALLHGGMGIEEREQLREAFQASPAEHPVRILLATDAASEGIDLQRHCHRLVNYDIPFNPNKLEQRIGRIDRYGQREVAQIRHFVGSGYEKARPGSYEEDLEFLSRVAIKVARMEEDLGAVNAVLAAAVQDRLLGRLRPDFDVDRATEDEAKRKRRSVNVAGAVPAEGNVGDQVRRLRVQLNESIAELHIAPGNLERVVSTALDLDRQLALEPVIDEIALAEGLFRVPTLTGSWERTTRGLAFKLRDKADQERPITFDPQAADGRDDVVLAHLGHPLTAMATTLLRAAMWGGRRDLNRVTALVSDDPTLEATVLAAFARLVLVGHDGTQLHEEIIHAGGWLRETGGAARFTRIEGVEMLGSILDTTLDASRLRGASEAVQARLAAAWPTARGGLQTAIEARRRARRDSLTRALDRRRDEEIDRITANLDQFAASLRTAIAADEPDDGQLILPLAELEQHRRDRASWRRRLEEIDGERDREASVIRERYRVVDDHVFPAAVVFVVPHQEAIR
ncbi:MAG TPA: DISARM system SNF2-like helicase DrmD [Streptosporangiaceae bacterium]|nr:DISARM system SNF2-like helicase DrmD [Streptosporangiaceae bacterium]